MIVFFVFIFHFLFFGCWGQGGVAGSLGGMK